MFKLKESISAMSQYVKPSLGSPRMSRFIQIALGIGVTLLYVQIQLLVTSETPSAVAKNGQSTSVNDAIIATKSETATASTNTEQESQQSTAVQGAVPMCKPGLSSKAQPLNLNNLGTGVHQSTVTRHYLVHGNTNSEISRQMRTCTPVSNGHLAETSYRINWQFDTVYATNGTCRAGNIKIGLSQAYTYPAWQASPATSPSVTGSWNRFINALRGHEQGHAALNYQYANAMYDELKNMAPVTCSALAATGNNLMNQRLSALHAANTSYDGSTGHGATQGATF